MFKSCNKCGNEFTPAKGLLNFCSLSCRNSREFSAEAKLKKSIKSRKAWGDGRMDMINFSEINNRAHKIEKGKSTWINKYLQERENGKLHSWDTIRKYHFIIQNNTCEVCGTCEWNGESVPLELHHINGDISDNGDDNLQVVCPNCHAQTNNFRGRNIKYSPTKFLEKSEVFDNRIEDFALSDLIKKYYEMDGPPDGYFRKRHYFITKYKISNGALAKLISIYRKDPKFLDMIDKDENLTITMVYKMIKK
jgi:5-methylcytosine-specific restriction endonuclease McrA